MKLSFLFILPFFFLSTTFPETLGEGMLTIVVNGIDTQGGSIRVAVFNQQTHFLERNGYVFAQSVPVDNKTSVQVSFKMPHGYYAVTTYHDVNDNRILDKNGMGIPTEPYGISNGFNTKWRKPTFDETKFAFNESNQTIYLDVKRWKDR